MADMRWKYVGYGYHWDNRCYFWTDGESIAWIKQSDVKDFADLSDIPDPWATIEDNVVRDKYDRNVIKWIDDWNITRDRLD